MAERWSSKLITRVRFLPPLGLKCFASMLIITILDQTVRSILALFYRLTATSPSQAQKDKHPTPGMIRVYRRRVLRILAPSPALRFVKHPTLTLVLALYYAVRRSGLGLLLSLFPVWSATALETLRQVKLPLSPKSLITALTRATLILVFAYFMLIYIHLACQMVPFAKILFA